MSSEKRNNYANLTNRSPGRIPGYTGFVPGSQNLCGKRYSETTIDAVPYTADLRAGAQHADMMYLASERRPHTISRPGSKGDGRAKEEGGLTGPPRLPQSNREGRMPGYAGFCPGTNNNALGSRFSRTTIEGREILNQVLQNEGRSSVLVPQTGSGVGLLKIDPTEVSKGHIPGYQGYCPGVENYTVGTRFAEGTHFGKLMISDIQKQKLGKLDFLEPSRPQNGVAEAPVIHKPEKTAPSKGKIPGYTGHVPGTRNTFAVTYYRSSNTTRTERGPYTTCESGHTNEIPKSTFLKKGGIIPGYAGYIPGLKPRNVYGERYPLITTKAAEEVQKPFRTSCTMMVT